MNRWTQGARGHADRRRQLTHAAHVWLADPYSFSTERMQRFASLLCAQERLRWQSFHFPRDRLIYLTAHGLLRQILSLYEDVLPDAWRFREGEHGKPALAEPVAGRSLSFNLSHTDGAIAIIVTDGLACGVDVERVDPHIDIDLLASAVHAPTEQQAWRTTPDYLKVSRFLETWTLKEAYLKGIGCGIGAGVDCIALRRTGGNEARVVGENAAAWRLNFFHLSSGHVLATALMAGAQHDRAVVLRRIELHRQTLENSRTVGKAGRSPAGETVCVDLLAGGCVHRRSLVTPLEETIYLKEG